MNKIKKPILHVGCNYHTKWQNNPSVCFTLLGYNNTRAFITFQGRRKVYKTDINNLIFIESYANYKKINRGKP